MKMTGFFFGVKGGKMREKESMQKLDAGVFLEQSYPEFYQYLKELGFPVYWYDERQFGGLVTVRYNEPSYCGDERKEKGRQPKASRSLKVFGGPLFPAMYGAKERGDGVITLDDVRQVVLSAWNIGIKFGLHDFDVEEWDDVHCGFGRLIADGSLGVGFAEGISPRDVVAVVGRENHVSLRGEHTGIGWILNFREGFTRVPDGELFGTDVEVFKRLGMDVDGALRVSARVVNLLKPDAGVVYIAK